MRTFFALLASILALLPNLCPRARWAQHELVDSRAAAYRSIERAVSSFRAVREFGDPPIEETTLDRHALPDLTTDPSGGGLF